MEKIKYFMKFSTIFTDDIQLNGDREIRFTFELY